MKRDLMQEIDKGYNLLKGLTDEETAKKIFKSYLLNEELKGDMNEVKLKVAFNNLSKNDIIAQIAKHGLTYACQKIDAPLNNNFVEFKEALIDKQVMYDQVVNYLEEDKKMLGKIIDAFIEQRYGKNVQYRFLKEIDDFEASNYIIFLNPTGKSNYKPLISGRISNLLFNKCRRDLLLNNQVNIDHKNYSLGKKLYATVERGNVHNSQEDSVIISRHPDSKDFKIIAVADGDSSKAYGEYASNFALTRILIWFENLDSKYFNDIDSLKELLTTYLRTIDFELKDSLKKSATTIAIAIVGNSKTLITTIGDTRIYTIKGNKITSETKDDSYVNLLCDKGLADKELYRFHKAIDFVDEELGLIKNEDVINNNTKIIDNDYDSLLILSDGVTKLVTNDKIEKIMLENKPEKVTESLVRTAMSESISTDKIDVFCNKQVNASEENMTSAMYVKRR